ncbi:hypothetical protein Taro_055451 [Colocasia esculenta]|uniref:Uncharacterized protein n=1 Tax=Colocasia esculenta TaxID=4460 RepID=A0A843XRE9_COLES|nr:hypothetical protein [Colocasia esculenta]
MTKEIVMRANHSFLLRRTCVIGVSTSKEDIVRSDSEREELTEEGRIQKELVQRSGARGKDCVGPELGRAALRCLRRGAAGAEAGRGAGCEQLRSGWSVQLEAVHAKLGHAQRLELVRRACTSGAAKAGVRG